MAKEAKARKLAVLTSGGDCPGLNAAIRAIAKSASGRWGMRVVGILEGFRGLLADEVVPLDETTVSGILTAGGTILGTSRIKPHKLMAGSRLVDRTDDAVRTLRRHKIDALVCLGGGGTQKTALRLAREGVNVITLPKTIDNDVAETDVSFGYDTATAIATEAIDRLHTTATSHHRIIVCELMGHRAGWLTLAAGVAGGADVILIPEIPYDLKAVARYILERRRRGKKFSIIAVAEGARSRQEVRAAKRAARKARTSTGKRAKPSPDFYQELWRDETRDGLPLVVRKVQHRLMAYHVVQEPMSSRIARKLQELTGMEARVTTLGHVQRGGVPSAFDRQLCTQLGTKAAHLAARGIHGVMVAYRGELCVPVPLEKVAGFRKTIPAGHPLLESARAVGTCLGDG